MICPLCLGHSVFPRVSLHRLLCARKAGSRSSCPGGPVADSGPPVTVRQGLPMGLGMLSSSVGESAAHVCCSPVPALYRLFCSSDFSSSVRCISGISSENPAVGNRCSSAPLRMNSVVIFLCIGLFGFCLRQESNCVCSAYFGIIIPSTVKKLSLTKCPPGLCALCQCPGTDATSVFPLALSPLILFLPLCPVEYPAEPGKPNLATGN